MQCLEIPAETGDGAILPSQDIRFRRQREQIISFIAVKASMFVQDWHGAGRNEHDVLHFYVTGPLFRKLYGIDQGISEIFSLLPDSTHNIHRRE